MNSAADYSAAPSKACSDSCLSVPPECAGLRIDQALARLFPEYSRNRLQAWLKGGQILLDGDQVEPKHKVWGGEVLEVLELVAAPSGHEVAEDLPLDVIFEDACLFVINKPAGLVVHPGNGNSGGTMMNALLHRDPGLFQVPRAGIVHRLDKETSGLLVVARTLQAQTDLVRQLQARTVSRRYLALVHGSVPTGGSVDAPIGRHPVQRTRMAVVKGAREAITHYSVVERFADTTLVECRLETGRTHQIRVHMAHIGYPLVGDPVYGKRRSKDPELDAFPRQALHAWRLSLKHPASGEQMGWEAPLPADFADLLKRLRRREGR